MMFADILEVATFKSAQQKQNQKENEEIHPPKFNSSPLKNDAWKGMYVYKQGRS